MKNFKIFYLLFVLVFMTFCGSQLFSQTKSFIDITAKTKQSYLDRGYKLVNLESDSIFDTKPLVSSDIGLDYKTYYIVHVQVDGCYFCEYKLYFVDAENNMSELNPEIVVKDDLKQAIYKFENAENSKGKYVVLLKSELPYYANIFVFKKKY
ncbi:MAG TPA: hypothetical protein PLW23_09320 [Bacteroidales bacterium]|nr:hypothetical protein [Bacteroidales bacterium]